MVAGRVRDIWDVVIVGSGPAGSAAAIAARSINPFAAVLLLDRSNFPRDKCCGDAVLGNGVRQLAAHNVSVSALLQGYEPVRELTLTTARGVTVSGRLPDPMTILPRLVFDARMLEAAREAGAVWNRHTVRSVRDHGGFVELDQTIRARVVIGADGAESAVRRAIARPTRGDVAVALRGYDTAGNDRCPTMVFEQRRGLAYAWRFPSTAGAANVGYGHLLRPGESTSREALLAAMHRLLPGIRPDPRSLRAHRLPLSSSRQPAARGRLLLAGDAAALVNPLSGEGIYYAIISGLLAGTAAATGPHDAAARYASVLRRRFGSHHRHAAVLASLTASKEIIEAGIRGAGAKPAVFNDLAALGLAEGRITARLTRELITQLARQILGGRSA